MSRRRSLQKSFTTHSGDDEKSAMRGSLYDLEAQLNTSTGVEHVVGVRPKGQAFGDSTIRMSPRAAISIAISDGHGNTREVSIPMNLLNNTAIADPSGGGTVDTQARAAIASLLALFRNLSIIST